MRISKILGFFRATVTRIIKNYETRGNVKDLPRSGRPKILNNDHQKVLKTIVKKNNTEPIEVIKEQFNQKTGLQVSINTLRRNLLGIKFIRGYCQNSSHFSIIKLHQKLILFEPYKS